MSVRGCECECECECESQRGESERGESEREKSVAETSNPSECLRYLQSDTGSPSLYINEHLPPRPSIDQIGDVMSALVDALLRPHLIWIDIIDKIDINDIINISSVSGISSISHSNTRPDLEQS